MELGTIRSLAESGEYERAISECDHLLQSGGYNAADVLRTRAYVHSHRGDYESALADRRAVLKEQDAQLRDYYLAAENALQAREDSLAIEYLETSLRVGAEQKEDWFRSAALFLLSYGRFRAGQFDAALLALDAAEKAEPEYAMPVPRGGVWDAHRLRHEIIAGMSKKS